VINKIFIL